MDTRHKLPSQAYLQARFTYDELTGVLTWDVRPESDFRRHKDWTAWNKKYAGTACVTDSGDGHLVVRLNGVVNYVHRIAYKMVTGQEPPHELDHKNQDGTDNRFLNLRPATRAQNALNMGDRKIKKSGFPRGVRPNGKGFSAKTKVAGVYHHIGTFKTPEEAHEAYREAAKRLHGEFCSER